MKKEQAQECRLFYADGDNIVGNGTRFDTLEQLKADFPNANWAIIPVGEVPDNWQDMTIVDGALVPASTEVIAAREVARGIAKTESKRQTKETLFRTNTDKKLFEAIETFAVAHPEFTEFESWLAEKNAIRTEVENPTTQEGGTNE